MRSLTNGVDTGKIGSFAALLPAADTEAPEGLASWIAVLVQRGCVEICCVGAHAEALHDIIDDAVEDLGRVDVVTTWDTSVAEGCDYFVNLAAGGRSSLVAFTAGLSEMNLELQRAARDSWR